MKRLSSIIVPAMAIAVLLAFLAPYSNPRPSEPLSCANALVVETVQRMAAGMSWPLGGPTIKIFKFYNYRVNPSIGAEPTLFTDTKSPCKVNMITDRGEFGFTYGWKLVDAEVFVMGQIGAPDDVRSP
jgi:hypothetical protein